MRNGTVVMYGWGHNRKFPRNRYKMIKYRGVDLGPKNKTTGFMRVGAWL
jgi:hypothetical protein